MGQLDADAHLPTKCALRNYGARDDKNKNVGITSDVEPSNDCNNFGEGRTCTTGFMH